VSWMGRTVAGLAATTRRVMSDPQACAASTNNARPAESRKLHQSQVDHHQRGTPGQLRPQRVPDLRGGPVVEVPGDGQHDCPIRVFDQNQRIRACGLRGLGRNGHRPILPDNRATHSPADGHRPGWVFTRGG
jgi:hypothetical protein